MQEKKDNSSEKEDDLTLISPEFVKSMNKFWSDRHGEIVEPPYYTSLLKLQNAQNPAERLEARKSLLADLINLLDEKSKLFDLKLEIKESEYYLRSGSIKLDTPFIDQNYFAESLYRLKKSLDSSNYNDCKILITFHVYILLQYLDEECNQICSKDIVNFFNQLAVDLKQLTSGTEEITDNLNSIFLSLMRINKRPNSNDFIQSLNCYIKSPVYGDFDHQIEAFFNIYNGRVYKTNEEATIIKGHHKKFINALIELRQVYFNHQTDDSSELDFVITQTDDMLKKMMDIHYAYKESEEQKKQKIDEVIVTFNKNCIEPLGNNSKFFSFIEALAAIALAVLSYISIIGAVVIYKQGEIPLDFAKKTCGLHPYHSLQRYLTFRPAEIQFKSQELVDLVDMEHTYMTKSWQIYK